MKKIISAIKYNEAVKISLISFIVLFGPILMFFVIPGLIELRLDSRDNRFIAIETENQRKGLSAVRHLSDQNELTDVAFEAGLGIVRQAAVKKLTDQDLLARIALDDVDWRVRRAAVEALDDYDLLSGLIEQTEDGFIRAYSLLTVELKTAPKQHRNRLRFRIFPAVRVMTDRVLTDEVGEIVSITTRWSEKVRGGYRRRAGSGTFAIKGESFRCSIRLKNISEPLSHSWETVFPHETRSLFEESKIDFIDILYPVFERLPQDLLAEIATGKHFEALDLDRMVDVRVRTASVECLTDQDLLSRIANGPYSRRVRDAARNRILKLRARPDER